MSYDNPFESLSYDEKVLSEKLEMYHRPETGKTMEQKIKEKMVEQYSIREQVKQEIQKQYKNRRLDGMANNTDDWEKTPTVHKIEKYTNKDDDDIFKNPFSEKMLLVIVFVLSLFCVVQYYTNQQLTAQMSELMKCMIQSKQPMGNNPTLASTIIASP